MKRNKCRLAVTSMALATVIMTGTAGIAAEETSAAARTGSSAYEQGMKKAQEDTEVNPGKPYEERTVDEKFDDPVFRELVMKELKKVPGRNESLNNENLDKIHESDIEYLAKIKRIDDFFWGAHPERGFDDRTESKPLARNVHGIEYLKGLEHIDLSGHLVEGDVDLNHCENLKYAGFGATSITALKVDKCSKLTYLNAFGTNISEIDLRGRNDMYKIYLAGCHNLDLSGDKIDSLELDKKTKIQRLNIEDTNAEKIVLNCKDTLELLGLNNTDVHTVTDISASESAEKGTADLTGYNNLKYIQLSDNKVTHAVIPESSVLGQLDISSTKERPYTADGGEKLEEGKPSKSVKFLGRNYEELRWLDASNSKITSDDFNSLGTRKMEYLDLSGTGVETVDLSDQSQIRYIHLEECPELTNVTMPESLNPKLENLASEEFNYKYIDEKNRYVGPDGQYRDNIVGVFLSDSPKVTELNINSPEKIKEIDIQGTGITDFDFSRLTDIKKINISVYKGNTVDLNGCGKLKELIAFGSDIETIKNMPESIETVNISENKNINSLDLSELKNIKSLFAVNSSLSSLKINSDKLEELDLTDSKISDFSGIKLNEGLKVLSLNSESEIERTGLQTLPESLTELRIKNSKFNEEIDLSKLSKLELLDAENAGLKSIDTGKMENLTSLWIPDNSISSLDLSKNKALMTLNVNGNKLKDLVLSETNNNLGIFYGAENISLKAVKVNGFYEFNIKDIVPAGSVSRIKSVDIPEDGFYYPSTGDIKLSAENPNFNYEIFTGRELPGIGSPYGKSSSEPVNLSVNAAVEEDADKTQAQKDKYSKRLEEEKKKAKKEIEKIENLSEKDEEDFKGKVDGYTGTGSICDDRIAMHDLINAAKDKVKSDADNFNKEKESAKEKINGFVNLEVSEKDGYKDVIDKASSSEEINRTAEEAEKINKERQEAINKYIEELNKVKEEYKVKIDGLKRLSDIETDSSKKAIDDVKPTQDLEKDTEDVKAVYDRAKKINDGRRCSGGTGGSRSSRSASAVKKQETETEKNDNASENIRAPRIFVEGTSAEEGEESSGSVIDKAYINGYEDGTVRPDGELTRAEMAAMLSRLKNDGELEDITGETSFEDVNGGWYDKYIAYAEENGMMKGYPDGSFKPDEFITRAELAQVIASMDVQNDAENPFTDIEEHWAKPAIEDIYGNGRIEGYEDGTFRPDQPVTRAETAKIINSFYNRGVDKEGMKDLENPEDIKQFTDFVDENSHWGYYELLEAANTHERIGMRIEKWVKIVKDKLSI